MNTRLLAPGWILARVQEQRVADGRWQRRVLREAPSDRGKSEHLQTTRRVEYAGAWRESVWQRKVSQKTDRPSIFGCGGKGEKAG